MLEAVFRGHDGFVVTAMGVVAIIWVVVFRLSSQNGVGAALTSTWVASIMGAVSLTLWSTGASHAAGSCIVDENLMNSLSNEQGLLNAAMFVPVGLFGVLATRRFTIGPAVGVLLSMAIETMQGAFPVLGRSCDTSDLIANSLGALLGAVCGWGLVRFGRLEEPGWNIPVRQAALCSIAFVVVLGLVWAGYIRPEFTANENVIVSAGDSQEAALRHVTDQAFGTHYSIQKIQFASASPGTATGTVAANLGTDGFIQISWPDPSNITASLDSSTAAPETGYPVPGASHPIATARNATRIASIYARSHDGWAIAGSRVQTAPVGDHAALGWIVSWRRYRGQVLMPMRLDVQVDRAGYISQLSLEHVPDVSVPPVVVSRPQAAAAAVKYMPSCTKIEVGELLAVRAKASWRAVWRVVASCGRRRAVINIDAATGRVRSRQLYRNDPAARAETPSAVPSR